MNMMRKKNNNNMRRGGGGGNNRRFNNHGGGGGGGNRNNDGQNIARQKHHATQMREKYTNMARDAQNNGDRVDVEYYLQHVDHYNRVLTDIAAIEAERFAAREPQHNPQAGHENTDGGEAAEGAAAASDGGEPVTQGNQPRMTRGHRRERHHNPQQQQGQQNEAPAEAATDVAENNQDIPLPESILPAI